MSMDNGTLLTEHPEGGYCLLNYSGSADEYPRPTSDMPQYPTIEAAVLAYQEFVTLFEKNCGMPYDEYGLSIRVGCS